MSSRAHRPPPTTTTATASARRESRLYDPQQAYYTDSQQQVPPSSSRKTAAKSSKQRDHHPPPAASSYYYNKGGYYSSYEQPTTAGAGIARPQSVAPSISSHRDYPAPPPARAPSAQPSLSHYTSHAQLPPARPPSTQPQQIARPPSRAGHGGVAPSISQGHSQSQAQAWAAYHAAAGTVPSSSYGAASGAAPGTSAPSAAQAQAPPPPPSTARVPSTSANAYPSLFEGYASGIDGYATSSYNNPPPSTSYGQPYQNMTIPGKARSSRHRDLEREYDPSPQSSNERVVWQRDAANSGAAAVDDQREGRSAPPPSAPIAVPGVAGTAKSSRHREREYGVPIAPSTSYKQGQYDIPGYAGSGFVIPPQGIAVAKSSRSVRERDAVPAGVAVAASTTRRRDKERDRGERTDAEDERREERRRIRERGDKTDVEDDRRRRDRERGGDKTDAEDDRRRDDRRRERDRGDKTDAEDDRRREERRRERERERERAARERDRDTDAEDAYRRRKEREREERRRDRERRAQTDAEDDAATARRREERRREREEEKRRDEEKRRERERERQEREREEERRREIRQERIRIEAEERERRKRIQAEADYRAHVEAQRAAAAAAQAQAEAEERQRRLQAEAHARAEAEERERQRAAHQAELEERERQRLALIEQERRTAKAEAEERQRRKQAETEERHRRRQAEAAAAKALAETPAREAEEQRRLQAEAQARHQAEARAQAEARTQAEAEALRARAEAEAQAAQAREQERQRRLQAEAEDKERHRQAYLEQQRQVAAAKAEAEERQRRLQAEAVAKAQAEAQEREREKQRRLQAQAEAEARERERQAAANAKAEAEERQRRRQEEAEERERQRRDQQAKAEAEERQRRKQEEAEERERQRRIQAENQAKVEAEERQRRRQEEAEERERQRRVQAENQAKAEAEERQRRRQEEAEERERQRRIQAENQAKAEAEERQRRRQEEAEERERQRRIQAEIQAKAEAEERQRRRQEEAEERERQRRIQAENQAKAEAEERERQRRLQAEAQAKAEAEERERQRQALARAQAEAEERERHRLATLEQERKAEEYRRRQQAEAEELERQHQYQLKLAAEAQEREHQRRLQAEAEEKERQRRQQAEEQERERRRYQAEQEERQRRYQAEVEERERQRRYQAEAEEKERQRRLQAEADEKERQRRYQAEAEEKERRRLQAEADEKERHRLAFLEQQRQVALAKAEAEERQRRLRDEAEAKERERMRQAADERQRRLQAEAEEKERERQKARAEAQARAEAEEKERQRRLQAEADEREKQRASAEEWARKEKERSAANTKPSNDLLWGPPPVPAKNSPPTTQPTSTSPALNQPSTSMPVPGHRHTASVPIATNSLHMHPQLQQQPQDSPPMRVLGDSNRDSPRNRKRDSQLLHPNIPVVVEKTGSGRYKEKSSRPTAIPTLGSHSNQSQSTNATSQIPPSSAPAHMQEFGVNPPASSSRDITQNDSVIDRDGTRDKRRASRLPENQPQPQLSHQTSKQPEAEPTSTAARLAALMTHTDSNLPYFQRKPSKDSLIVNPNTSGFLISPAEFSRNRRPSNEPFPIHEVDNPTSQHSRAPISAPAAISTIAQGSPLHKQADSQPGYLQEQRVYDRHPSNNAAPVLPLHTPQELIDSTNQQVPRSSTEAHPLTRDYGETLATQVERERQESTRGEQHESEREVVQVVQDLTQTKAKKGRKETKKEKAKAKEEKKKEKEREKENLAASQQRFTQDAEEEANGDSTIKAKSTSKHKGLPEIWTLGRTSQEERRTSPTPNALDHDGAKLPSFQEPNLQNSTAKPSKKERRKRRHISFGQSQEKAGQESSSEHEMATGTWGKGSLRGFFKNSERTPMEDVQVSSTDTDQDPEAVKRHKRRTSSRIQEGFSAAVEASAKLASLLVPGRGNRSRKSSHHSIMATHEPSVDQDQQTAARFSTDDIADIPSDQHQRKLSEDTNTIPFPQPTTLGKGPIVSAPIMSFGDGPELIVPRSPYRGGTNLPPSLPIPNAGSKQDPLPSVSNAEQDQNRARDAQRLAALIDVPMPSSESRSRSASLAPAPGRLETLPAASSFDSAAPQSKNVAQQRVHHEDHRPSLERPSASTYVSPPAVYHGSNIAHPPPPAPQASERPVLPGSVSYSSTTAEASWNGSSLMPSNSSFGASTILPNSETTQALPVADTKDTLNVQSRQAPVNNGDTSMIAQLLSRPSAPKDPNPTSTMPQSQPSKSTEAVPIPMDASTRAKDVEKPPADVMIASRPIEKAPHSSSTVPPHLYVSHQEANTHGSKERIPDIEQPIEPRNADLPKATPSSAWTKPPPSMPILSVYNQHTSSYDPDGPRAQAPQASASNVTPQQPAVLRTKDSSHSRQNSQDTLVDTGLKSSPHDKPSAIASAAKGSPLAKRNGSQDMLATKDSSQQSLINPTAVTTAPEQPSSRTDTTSRMPNLLSGYPESRSRSIPNNTQPVSLLPATAPATAEPNSKTVTSTSNNNTRPRPPPLAPDSELPPPLASNYSTRLPNLPPTGTSVQHTTATIPPPEKAPTTAIPVLTAASSSKPFNFDSPTSRLQDDRAPAVPLNPAILPPLSSKPAPAPQPRAHDPAPPSTSQSRPSERPSHTPSRSVSQPVPSTTTAPALTSRSQEEIAAPVISPIPLSAPPTRTIQPTTPAPALDRKAAGTPYPVTRSAPDPVVETPPPAAKSKVERSPPTQLRQHLDPPQDTKPDPPQPTEPTTRRVRPIRGVADQGPHRLAGSGQTVTVQVTPDASRRERARAKDRETTRKRGLFSIFRSRDTPAQHTLTTAEKPMTDSNESLPDSALRLRPVESAPATMTPLIPVATVISKIEDKREIEIVSPIPVHGNGKPLSKRHAPFRVTAKRYRTVSQASMDAADGNTVSMIMSGADSIRSSTAGRPSPPLRDPILAAMEWRNKEEAAHQDRGKRRRRPGVVFDIEDEQQTEKEKVPAKLVRRGTRGRLTKPPPDSAGHGD